jgi:copper(I)-binding protein
LQWIAKEDMTMWKKLFCIALLMSIGNAWAGNEVLVDKIWLRESVPGQESASLQLNLTVTKPAKLTGVSSPWATTVEIQRLSPVRGKMKAHAVRSVRLSRNRTLVFGEHSVSLMMVGLKQPLKVGDHVPVTLTVEFSGKQARIVEVEAEVKALELSYKHYGGQEVHDH